MARPRRVDSEMVAKAQELVAKTTDLDEFRAAQAVLLPALAHTTLEQTATLLGVGRSSVPRLQAQLKRQFKSPALIRRRWGGRRRDLLTPQEEDEFLDAWLDEDKSSRL